MGYIAQFQQADNLEFVYQVFTDLTNEGLNRYSFSDKYSLADRQGAYYLNAICFIGLAEKKGKDTFLNEQGRLIQQFEEPFRRKVFMLAILENQFICDTYHVCKGRNRSDQKQIAEIMIEGTYGINDPVTKARRARTLLSWYRWFEQQDFHIEEKYNE